MAEIQLSSAVIEEQLSSRILPLVQLSSVALESSITPRESPRVVLASITLEEAPLQTSPVATISLHSLSLEARLSKPNTKLGNIFF